MDKKKILVVCQHYYPENFQVTDICEELVKCGHEVTALVGLPNYPLGYVLDDYKHHKNRIQNINGVHIVRCFEIGRRKSKIFLALNYISFWFSSLLRINSLPDDFDVVLGYETSPVTMVDAGRKYAKKHNKPFIIWCCDIWPECLKVYIKSENNLIFRFFKKISKDIYSSANKILCSSPSFIDYLEETHNISEDKLEYLPQFGDDSLLEEDFTPIDNGIIDLVFLGNVGQEQDLSSVVKALSRIKDENFVLHIVGDGSDLENVKNITKQTRMEDKVFFYGRRPKEEMKNFYKLADACVLSLRCKNRIGDTIPNKLINYIASGKMVFNFAYGDAKKIVNDNNLGININDLNIDYLRKIITNLKDVKYINNYIQNNRNYYKKLYKKNIIIKKIEKEIKI